MAKGIMSIKRGIAVLLSACMVFGMTPIQAGAEENDSEIAVQANDSAGRTEQQSTDEASVTINGTTLYYATLEEAFSAANGNYATIDMLKDAECINHAGIPFCVDSWDSCITLKMNGKTLCGQGKEGSGAITVKEGSLAIQGPGRILSIYKGWVLCKDGGTQDSLEVYFDLLPSKPIIKKASLEYSSFDKQYLDFVDNYLDCVIHSENCDYLEMYVNPHCSHLLCNSLISNIWIF